jgi:selenocysteine-specific elongation factor
MALTLGTAGHIDHGKTALVHALTGVDTDRLPEEKARGISIALGYAPLTLATRTLSVVDVPGHERFVRTMVAGATGIDLYLMVVAADDGVMPQTREHAAVLAALGVEVGVVAVTKADIADPQRAAEEAAELLPGAEIVSVSARTGEGLGALRAALETAAAQVTSRAADGPLRLHVDRVFTIHGAGTVVTGTLWSGTAERGANVTVLPGGVRARIRSVEVHDTPVDRAEAGQRVALNLVARGEISRGDVITDGPLAATYRIDAELHWVERPKDGARIAVHHGTRESAARIIALGDSEFQLRLEKPLIPMAGDRLVIRSLAPPNTLGGGVIIDPAPRRHRSRLERAEPEAPPEPPKPERAPLSEPARVLGERLRDAGYEPPLDEDRDLLAELREHGIAVRFGPTMHIHTDALDEVRARVIAAIERDGQITLAGLRDELQTSRKYAQALLEHLDGERVTLRRGDARVLRRRRASAP